MKPQNAIDVWVPVLRLGSWRIVYSPLEPDHDDQRSCVDIDVLIRSAVVRLRSDTPTSQVERQVVHELLHVVLSGLEDTFRSAKEHTPKGWDDAGDRMWSRAEETAIEALTDALTGSKRADWGPSGEPWISAFPASE